MSAACLLIPTVAHVAAGGGVPAHAGFLFVAALLSVSCVALAGRRRSLGQIAALLLLSQPMLHVLLTLAGHHESAGAGVVSVVSDAPMLLAHLLAAGVLTGLLAGAETVAWSMAALSATVLLRRARWLLTPLASVGRPIRPWLPDDDEPAAPRVVHLVRSTPWRGPPAPVGC